MITQEDPSQKYPLPEFVFEKMSGSAEDFYCHSIGKVATVAAEGVNTHAANLRYCIQIHASLMSTMTERSFYQVVLISKAAFILDGLNITLLRF